METKRNFIAIAVALVAALVLVGGAAFYLGSQKVAREVGAGDPVRATTTDGIWFAPADSRGSLTLQLVLNGAGFVDGGKEHDGRRQTIARESVVFGDLDGDRRQEAVARISACTPECGVQAYIFRIGADGKVSAHPLPGTSLADGSAKRMGTLRIADGQVYVELLEKGESVFLASKVGFPDGKLAVLSQEFVRAEETVLSPEIAVGLLKSEGFADCLPGGAAGSYKACELVITKTGYNTWHVQLTYDGLFDDSIRASRINAGISYRDGQWVKGEVSKHQRCYPGRGHQDFSSASCI